MQISRAQLQEVWRLYAEAAGRLRPGGGPGEVLSSAGAATEAGRGRGEGVRREGAGRADRLELSEDARALADLIRRAAEAPDDPARAQRVEEIRRRIESGTYHVPAEDIARQMLSRILGDGASRRLGDHGH